MKHLLPLFLLSVALSFGGAKESVFRLWWKDESVKWHRGSSPCDEGLLSAVMEELNRGTCLRFEKVDLIADSSLMFINGKWPSHIGRFNSDHASQPIAAGIESCQHETILHRLYHTLGLIHGPRSDPDAFDGDGNLQWAYINDEGDFFWASRKFEVLRLLNEVYNCTEHCVQSINCVYEGYQSSHQCDQCVCFDGTQSCKLDDRDNECIPNPCPEGETCHPSPKMCFTDPCPQYFCGDGTGNGDIIFGGTGHVDVDIEIIEEQSVVIYANPSSASQDTTPTTITTTSDVSTTSEFEQTATTGKEFDNNECLPNPCPEDQTCHPFPNMCITDPCPQYFCGDGSGQGDGGSTIFGGTGLVGTDITEPAVDKTTTTDFPTTTNQLEQTSTTEQTTAGTNDGSTTTGLEDACNPNPCPDGKTCHLHPQVEYICKAKNQEMTETEEKEDEEGFLDGLWNSFSSMFE